MVPWALQVLSHRFPWLSSKGRRCAPAKGGQLAHHEADVAACTLPVTHPLLTARTLGNWMMSCVFPADHVFAQRRAVCMVGPLREPPIALSEATP